MYQLQFTLLLSLIWYGKYFKKLGLPFSWLLLLGLTVKCQTSAKRFWYFVCMGFEVCASLVAWSLPSNLIFLRLKAFINRRPLNVVYFLDFLKLWILLCVCRTFDLYQFWSRWSFSNLKWMLILVTSDMKWVILLYQPSNSVLVVTMRNIIDYSRV